MSGVTVRISGLYSTLVTGAGGRQPAIEIWCHLFSQYEKDGILIRWSLKTVFDNILTWCVCFIGFSFGSISVYSRMYDRRTITVTPNVQLNQSSMICKKNCCLLLFAVAYRWCRLCLVSSSLLGINNPRASIS